MPVVQLSLDVHKKPKEHYDLAKELATLRRKGVLIIGSGNMVHNLRMVDWQNPNKIDYAFDWAQEARTGMNDFIRHDNHQALIDYHAHGRAFQLAVPTPEHFLPLLYVLALKEKDEAITLFNDHPVGGSLTMTSVKVN